MDVLRRAFELCERGNRSARVRGERMVDLEEQRLVGLDDQWAISHEELFSAEHCGPPGPEGRVPRNRVSDFVDHRSGGKR